MKSNRKLVFQVALPAVLVGGLAFGRLQSVPVAQGRGGAPAFKVDPMWPKPLPNHWLFGSITGVAVDAQDHIWVVHRGADSLNARTEIGLVGDPPSAEACCAPAPQVLEFDPAGNLVGHWGGAGQGYEWPLSPGGIAVDGKGNVWITASGPPNPLAAARGTSDEAGPARGGGAGRAGGTPAAGAAGRGGSGAAPRPQDAHVLKFSRSGQFVMQIGHAGKTGDSNSTDALNRPTAIDVDTAANEVYVADGLTNRRIVVFDAQTGAYKRHWGAYGAKPDDANLAAYDPAAAPAKQFNAPSCVKLSKDGMVYVCDRKNNRIQVFQKDGKFVKEGIVSKATLGEGAAWDVAFSRDPQQQFLYVADGQDQKVFLLRRDTLEVVTNFGDGGRWPGYFYGVGSVALDSKGNVYTGETFEGKRLQKFVAQGGGR